MRRGAQRGFLIMAAVFLVVVVGAFIAYMATQSSVQQTTSAEDVQSARALQAARAGLEWGSYQILINNACTATTLTFAGTSLAAFSAAVSCTSGSATEGASTVAVYQLVSTACNIPLGSAPVCPNSGATSATYVERQVSLTISKCTANC